MSSNFFAASGQFLSSATSNVNALPITIACWFRANAVSGRQVFCEVGAYGSSIAFLGLNGASLSAGSTDWGVGFSEALSGTATTGTWHHGCAIINSNTDRRAFLNGSRANDTANVAIGALSTMRVGMYVGALYNFDGQIAELGIWNVALTDAEVTALAKGLSPLKVRSANLADYWTLVTPIGNATSLKGNVLVNSGAATHSAEHPRIYR